MDKLVAPSESYMYLYTSVQVHMSIHGATIIIIVDQEIIDVKILLIHFQVYAESRLLNIHRVTYATGTGQ